MILEALPTGWLHQIGQGKMHRRALPVHHPPNTKDIEGDAANYVSDFFDEGSIPSCLSLW